MRITKEISTTAQFRRWLEEKIAWLQDCPSEERLQEDHEYAKGFVDEAYDYAVRADATH